MTATESPMERTSGALVRGVAPVRSGGQPWRVWLLPGAALLWLAVGEALDVAVILNALRASR
jgi:hypothetical protein